MTKQEKQVIHSQSEMIEATKGLVTQSRTWAISMREAMLAPWSGATESNEIASMMMTPWLSMTRMAHDRWLDIYETQTTEMIERTASFMKQVNQIQR